MTMSREQRRAYSKAYMKAYRQAHKEQCNAYSKAWKESHKEQCKASVKDWQAKHKEQYNAYQKAYQKDYNKSDLNSLGQTKQSIRVKSLRYLNKSGIKIPGYEIHHCFGYEDPSKFIYCSKELHHLIHSYLRQYNIDSDSDHYEYIKHLLDDSVVKYGI